MEIEAKINITNYVVALTKEEFDVLHILLGELTPPLVTEELNMTTEQCNMVDDIYSRMDDFEKKHSKYSGHE